MKKVLLISAGLFLSILTIFSFSACTDNEADDPNSQSARDKFLGTWNVEESCVRLDYENLGDEVHENDRDIDER